MSNYEYAKDVYASLGVDVEKAMERLAAIPVSLHCWQGDDVSGFENNSALTGGIAVTGNYPGRARNPEELRADIDFALSFIPGTSRVNLHAIYAESGNKKVDRNELTVECFANWIDWAKDKGIALDFNPSYFSHPKSENGTLANPDPAIRKFWIEHGIACRKIAGEFGKRLGKTCVTNHWCPDGSKDTPFDRLTPREWLKESLDTVFAEKIDKKYNLDAVESKLFGIGAESYTVGSHEFYMGYAIKNDLLLCLDAGHFHPTEVISDKISSALLYVDDVLLHVSRGVRWDSDHVVTLTDELQSIADEIIRHNFDKRVHIGLDYFDGSINRIAAWIIGARNMQKALLRALLEPAALIAEAENSGNFAKRLALMEESRTLPFHEIWKAYCERCGKPGVEWISAVEKYENDVQSLRK